MVGFVCIRLRCCWTVECTKCAIKPKNIEMCGAKENGIKEERFVCNFWWVMAFATVNVDYFCFCICLKYVAMRIETACILVVHMISIDTICLCIFSFPLFLIVFTWKITSNRFYNNFIEFMNFAFDMFDLIMRNICVYKYRFWAAEMILVIRTSIFKVLKFSVRSLNWPLSNIDNANNRIVWKEWHVLKTYIQSENRVLYIICRVRVILRQYSQVVLCTVCVCVLCYVALWCWNIDGAHPNG